MSSKTVYRSCTLCEACCGLTFEVENNRIVDVAPDHDDVHSHGFVCPKGMAMPALQEDPDRLRTPVRRGADGSFHPISWEEALDTVGRRLREIRDRDGADAIAVYIGNPVVHNHAALLMRQGLLSAIGTKNASSASSQDTAPRFASSYYLYGNSLSIPIPDIDRTDYFLCIGANPLISNGSFLTAPDMKGRIKSIRDRGGKVVVVDPRRSETAERADEHVSIRPGADAALLLAMAQSILAGGRGNRAFLKEHCQDAEALETALAPFTPERVAGHTGVGAATIERLAREFAEAPSSAAYSRIGVCNNLYGTLASYATDILNIVAGRLGTEGGALFTTPALDLPRMASVLGGDGHARWHSRVRGLPETVGDIPASTLAEEMETPGPGQVRALLTYAGNPVLSTPNGIRLARALESLEFMVCVDMYVNETSRFADIILPPAGPLAEEHVDLMFLNFAARNVARVSPPVVEPEADGKADWQILLAIAREMGGGPTGIALVDKVYNASAKIGYDWTPHATIALALRFGPHGQGLNPFGKGLTMKRLQAAPHGIDLGPLDLGFKRRVFHKDGRIRLAPQPMTEAMKGLGREIEAVPDPNELLLVGRRELRTSNSWIHNVPAMVAGKERCVVIIHPDDARRVGIAADGDAVMESRVHRGRVRVKISDEIRPGVVSMPHGWGHAPSAPWQKVAGANPGVSVNDWTDDALVEGIVGQAVLNGVPVRLKAAEARATEAA